MSEDGYTVKDLIKFLESLGDREIEVRIDTNNDNIYLSADRYIFSGSYTLDLVQYLKDKGAKLLW